MNNSPLMVKFAPVRKLGRCLNALKEAERAGRQNARDGGHVKSSQMELENEYEHTYIYIYIYNIYIYI